LPKIVTGAAVAAVLLMLGIMPGHTQVAPLGNTTPSVETSRQIELLGKLLDIVRSEYVDKLDEEKLLTSAIKGILSSLDPHSSYLDAKSYRFPTAWTNCCPEQPQQIQVGRAVAVPYWPW
jgi:carboxyl-terminal processing protease